MGDKCISILLCVVMLLAIAPIAIAEEVEPSLIVTYTPSDDAPQLYEIPLTEMENMKWLWLQVPETTPLNNLSLQYEPSDVGYVQFVDEYGQPLPLNMDALDMSMTETQPYAYQVIDSLTNTILWEGWLTVSHAVRPADLPDQPTPMPTLEPTETPTEVPTETPTEEPTVVPTETVTILPTEVPTMIPTEIPTEIPTTVPTETPTMVPTPSTSPVPTQAPTPVRTPTPRPTFAPTAVPTPPPNQAGYAVITANNVNVRETPGGAVIGRLQYGEVIYVTEQRYDWSGAAWHVMTAVERGLSGYVHAGYVRFMTPQEVQDYLNRPTPRPTQRPTATPKPIYGYARIVWQSTPLRTSGSTSAAFLKTLYMGQVVYITGQSFDSGGTRWFSVQADSAYGYITAASAVMMTQDEVAEYLESLKPTPKPTVRPTLDPSKTYMVVNRDNVNFRVLPNGTVKARVHRGTVAQLLADAVEKDGYQWYRVEIDGDTGYLRSDMVDFLQIAPTASPSPSPSPTPLPTFPPMSMVDRIRAAVDTARYREVAQNMTEGVAYTVRDFDSDGLMELLLVSAAQQNGKTQIALDVYRFKEGAAEKIAETYTLPALEPLRSKEIAVVTQTGRTVVSFVDSNTETGKLITGGLSAMTLTDEGWVPSPMTAYAKDYVIVVRFVTDAEGTISIEDYSGLTSTDDAAEREEEITDMAAILQVLLRLVETTANGNG